MQISAGLRHHALVRTLDHVGAVIPYASFNTECWEGGAGTAYAKQAIDTLQLIVPGGAAEAPLDVQLTAIKEM